jgi:hypothetical protein
MDECFPLFCLHRALHSQLCLFLLSHGACQTISISLPTITERATVFNYFGSSQISTWVISGAESSTMTENRPFFRPIRGAILCLGNSAQRRRLFVSDNKLWNGTQAYLDVIINLLAALHRIRDPAIEKNVWIDAICIYLDRPSIKNLRNLQSFTQHLKELN